MDGGPGRGHDDVMSERPPDLRAAADRLAALSDAELAAVIARSDEAFAAGENGPDVPVAYPLHAVEGSDRPHR